MNNVVIEHFLREWFCGPLNLCFRIREFGYSLGPLRRAPFRRDTYALEGFLLEFGKLAKRGFRKLNALLSIASYSNLEMDEPIYDALHYDFDCEWDPSRAVSAAVEFARSLRERFGCDAVIYTTGFKGAHVVIPLKAPTDWEGYELTWRALIAPYKYVFRGLVDDNMLQPNRLDRVPFTYNCKLVNGEPKSAYTRIVTLDGKPLKPDDFNWSLYEPLDITQVEVVRVELPAVPKPKVVVLRRRRRGQKEPLPPTVEGLAGSEVVPPCMRNIIDAFMKAGNLDHYQRVALALYLKWVGFSVDDIVEFFKRHAKDFNERVTRYQVEYLYGLRGSKKDFLPYSCSKLKGLGICLGCGWDRNPVTFTYKCAAVPDNIIQRFFNTVKKVI